MSVVISAMLSSASGRDDAAEPGVMPASSSFRVYQ